MTRVRRLTSLIGSGVAASLACLIVTIAPFAVYRYAVGGPHDGQNAIWELWLVTVCACVGAGVGYWIYHRLSRVFGLSSDDANPLAEAR